MEYPDLPSNFEEDFQAGGVVALHVPDTEFDYRASAYRDSLPSRIGSIVCEPNWLKDPSFAQSRPRSCVCCADLAEQCCRLHVGVGPGLDFGF